MNGLREKWSEGVLEFWSGGLLERRKVGIKA